MKICKKSHTFNKELKQCPECRKASKKAWYEANQEQVKANVKVYYDSNKEQYKANRVANQEQIKAYNKAYRKANPAKMNANRAKRIAKKRHATPPWLTTAQLHSIELFYQAASWVQSILEEPIEVDHIVPLQGKDVCGLHVPWNLQLLPAALNRSKGNKT